MTQDHPSDQTTNEISDSGDQETTATTIYSVTVWYRLPTGELQGSHGHYVDTTPEGASAEAQRVVREQYPEATDLRVTLSPGTPVTRA
jgi:hypothetical protein